MFTLASAPRRTRPLLSEVFGSGLDSDFPACPEVKVGHEKVNGARSATENGLNGSLPAQEYELKTVSISKTKQSLGESSSSFSNHAPEEIQDSPIGYNSNPNLTNLILMIRWFWILPSEVIWG